MNDVSCFEDVEIIEEVDGSVSWECRYCSSWQDGFDSVAEAVADAQECGANAGEGPCVRGHNCTGPHVYLSW